MAVSQGLDEGRGARGTRRVLKPHVASRRSCRYAGAPCLTEKPTAASAAITTQNPTFVQGTWTLQEPTTLGAPRRTSLRGAAELARVLQRCLQRFQMTIIAFWKEALQDNLVPGGSSFEGPFRPMGSLCSLSSVQVEEEVPELHLQWRLLSHSLEDVNEWLRRKRLVRVSAAWRGLADNHRAKRLIKKVCAQLHVQAIVKKAFAVLVQHHRRVSARQLALLQVVDQWVEEKLLQQVVRSLRFWRSKAAKGSILRRGGLVLKRFLDASCVRKWLGTWISNVIRAKRISECMAILEKKLHITLRDKVLKAWHRVSRCTQAAQQVSEQKNSQRAQVALSRWVNTWRATRCRRLQLTSKCWQGFHAELHRRRCGVVVRSRCQDMEARAALLRWDMAISLRRKETALRQMIQVRELRLTVQRWQRLRASKAMEVKRLLGSTLRTWFTITGHLLFERQQREIETFGEGGLAGPTEWQSRQWRRGQRRCWNVWVQVVQKSAKHDGASRRQS